MMISPEYYRETIKDYTLEQLFKERDELLKEIRRYRRHKISPEKYQMAPSPSVIYKCNLKYLEQVSELINEKMVIEAK